MDNKIIFEQFPGNCEKRKIKEFLDRTWGFVLSYMRNKNKYKMGETK